MRGSRISSCGAPSSRQAPGGLGPGAEAGGSTRRAAAAKPAGPSSFLDTEAQLPPTPQVTPIKLTILRKATLPSGNCPLFVCLAPGTPWTACKNILRVKPNSEEKAVPHGVTYPVRSHAELSWSWWMSKLWILSPIPPISVYLGCSECLEILWVCDNQKNYYLLGTCLVPRTELSSRNASSY